VRAFLRLPSDRLSRTWSEAASGSIDVLLTAADDPPTIPGVADDPRITLRVVEASRAVPGDPTTLGSPIQYDDLMEALAEAERRWTAPSLDAGPSWPTDDRPTKPMPLGPGDDDAATQPMPLDHDGRPFDEQPTEAMPLDLDIADHAGGPQRRPPSRSPATPLMWHDDAPAVMVRPTAAPVAVPAPSGHAPRPATGTAITATPFQWSPTARWRLTRWPPAEVLAVSRHAVRLASYVSAKHLSLDQLVELSRLDRAECERFLRSVGQAGLLRAQTDAPPAAARPAPGASAPAPHEPAPSPATRETRGLLAKLRRRLGLSPR